MMTPSNIAIVLGPNLLWSKNEAANLTSIGKVNTFALLLLQYYDTLFLH